MVKKRQRPSLKITEKIRSWHLPLSLWYEAQNSVYKKGIFVHQINHEYQTVYKNG